MNTQNKNIIIPDEIRRWQQLEHKKYIQLCHNNNTKKDEDWESLRIPEDARRWQQLEHRKFIKLKYQSM